MTRMRVRRGAFAAAGLMPLAQSFRKREGAVGGASDHHAFDVARGDERGARLVITQAPARLGVKMHRRRPSAGEEQRVAIARPPADAHGLDAPRPDGALDRGAERMSVVL